MTKTMHSIKRFIADERGTALMEYTILLGILVVAVITIITTLGGWISAQWTKLCNSVPNKTGACS